MQEPISMSSPVRAFVDALLALDRLRLKEIITAFEDDTLFSRIDRLMVPALEEIGAQWEQGHVSLSQVYMSGRLSEELITALLPSQILPGDDDALGQDAPAGLGAKVAINPSRALNIGISTLDDYHLLGKRMVCAVLRASGYQLRDYGTADAVTLANHVVRDGVRVLLISVLMLPSALRVRDLRAALDAAGQRTRILVGGAPFRFDPKLYLEVGADAAGNTAADALALVRAAEEALT